MKKMKIENLIPRCLLLLCALLSLEGVQAQRNNQVSVRASMDSTVIWMGEQTSVKLELSQPKGETVVPLLGDTLAAGVEILKRTQPDTVELDNNRIQINQELIVTSFDSGFYYIHPIRYVLQADTFASESLSLKVVPVEVDTTKMGFDIKGVKKPKFVLTDYLPSTPILLLILLLLLIAAAVYYYMKHRKTQEVEVVDPADLLPPHVRALQSLEEIKESKLWQNGREKEYYTRITDVIRLYIAQRFDLNAMELTSNEILQLLARNSETKQVYHRLKEVLEMSDLVKFAKMQPLPDDNEQSMRNAILFIEETKVEEPEPTPEEETPQAEDETQK